MVCDALNAFKPRGKITLRSAPNVELKS
jgi:hypothetical protein